MPSIFWWECGFSEEARQAAVVAARPCAIMNRCPQDQAVRDGMCSAEKTKHCVSARMCMGMALEQRLRALVVPIWVKGAQQVSAVFKSVNDGWLSLVEYEQLLELVDLTLLVLDLHSGAARRRRARPGGHASAQPA